ncbi:MAG: DUF1232 domain-containing protein [Saprospiraceae bacterium]|nr:DUF1232 domain-containing protein [Saprospiraceae bacterium]
MDFREKIEAYRSKFSESKFWRFLERRGKSLSQVTIYSALLLFYAYRRKDTPGWAKRIVLGSLGYLLMPLDAIPDLSPLIGYTDDIGVLSFGIVTIAAYINSDVRRLAKEKLEQWFDHIDEEAISKIDGRL